MSASIETLIALGKAAPKLADKDDLAVGTYTIDEVVTLHLLGTLTKLADAEYTPTSSIPLLDSVALFISRMGPVRRGEVLALWEQCVRDTLLGKGEVEDGIRGDIEDMHEKIRDSLDALPKKVRAGEIRAKVDCKIIDWPAVDAVPVSAKPVQTKAKAASRARKAVAK